jgi:hypothetical protein
MYLVMGITGKSRGRDRIPDGAGSALRAHFCGTVPEPPGSEAPAKGLPRDAHLTKKRRYGTGRERATTVIERYLLFASDKMS